MFAKLRASGLESNAGVSRPAGVAVVFAMSGVQPHRRRLPLRQPSGHETLATAEGVEEKRAVVDAIAAVAANRVVTDVVRKGLSAAALWAPLDDCFAQGAATVPWAYPGLRDT
jgi:hypothetical protein